MLCQTPAPRSLPNPHAFSLSPTQQWELTGTRDGDPLLPENLFYSVKKRRWEEHDTIARGTCLPPWPSCYQPTPLECVCSQHLSVHAQCIVCVLSPVPEQVGFRYNLGPTSNPPFSGKKFRHHFIGHHGSNHWDLIAINVFVLMTEAVVNLICPWTLFQLTLCFARTLSKLQNT